MKLIGRKGFTLIEVIVVAGIIAILAGILVPLIFKEINESRVTRAAADIRSISTAVMVFNKDTAKWPVMNADCTESVTLLTGDGNLPANLAALGYDTGVTRSFNDHLPVDTSGCYTNWKGPYIARVSADAWGYSYVSNASSFAIQNSPVWIVSVGPNGQLETPSFSETLQGDDVGLRLK